MLVNDFKWVKDISEFNEDFIKSNNDESDETIFLKLMFNILKICITFTMIYSFLPIIPEKMKTETVGIFALNHVLVLKKVHKITKLDQKARLKLEHRSKKKLQKWFWKIFLKSNAVFKNKKKKNARKTEAR